VPIITDNTRAFPGSNSFLAVPSSFPETTALGLYYHSTPQAFNLSPLSIQVDASILSNIPPSARETREVRAATPTSAGKTRRPVAHAKSFLECPKCKYKKSVSRRADFLRHLKTHEDPKLTRYVCCGIPIHPAAATLRPKHSVCFYKGLGFYGGCGKSYARMDALQRHIRKSNCVGASTKEHRKWRHLYL